MITKYPHTATLSWYDAGTTNSVGVITPGTLHTMSLTCDIQPVSNRYITGDGGAVINYSWHVFADLISGVSSIPNTAKLRFFNVDHIIVQLFSYQKHTEIKCQG